MKADDTPGIALLLGKPKKATEDDAKSPVDEDDEDPDAGARDGGQALLDAVEGKDADGVAAAVKAICRIMIAQGES
jgi:hypothetical protein